MRLKIFKEPENNDYNYITTTFPSSVGKKLAYWEKPWHQAKLAEFIQFSCLASDKTFRIHLVCKSFGPGQLFSNTMAMYYHCYDTLMLKKQSLI